MTRATIPPNRSTARQPSGAAAVTPSFTWRVLVVVGIVAVTIVALLLLWYAASVMLLAFTGVMLAIFLRSLSDFLSKHTPLSDAWSLALVVIALLALVGVSLWFLAPNVAAQIDELTTQIPRMWERLEDRVTQYRWVQVLLAEMPSTGALLPGGSELLRRAMGIFSNTLSALASFLIILFVGLYLAINPTLYRDGLVRLVPHSHRPRAREVLGIIGYTLRWWLIGKIAAMLVIGALTAAGLWLLGVPIALTLGLIAALLSFIPNIGPTLALVPGVLIGLTQSPTQALYVFFVYIGVQAIESYLLTPMIEQQTVSLPPALTLLTIALMGLLFGLLGVLLAAPLMATVLVLVKTLYIEDTLGDEIDVPGEDTDKSGDSSDGEDTDSSEDADQKEVVQHERVLGDQSSSRR